MELFGWDEAGFLRRTEGSAIRRIGWLRWLRNIAVALGNAEPAAEVIEALEGRRGHPSALVREHVAWALERLREREAERCGSLRSPAPHGNTTDGNTPGR